MDMTGMGGSSAMDNENNTEYLNMLSNQAVGAEQTKNADVAGYSSKANVPATNSDSVLGAATKNNGTMQNYNSVLGTSYSNGSAMSNNAVLGAATKNKGTMMNNSSVLGTATKNNGTMQNYNSVLGASYSNGSMNNNAVLGAATKNYDNAVLGVSAESPEECICDDVESYVKSSAQAPTCDLLADACINPECFGSSSLQYADCLLGFIYDEHVDCQSYCALAYRAPNSCARRVFRCLAECEKRHSNRFVTAYFLITGKRFCPARNDFDVTVSTSQSYCEMLRQLYFEESCDAAKYQAFASKVTDPCLRDLALEIAEDEKRHAQQIMSLIRKICTCGRNSN